MPVLLAESAGFCFGVNKAVNQVNALLDAGESVCTLGPIIHNPQVVEQMRRRGVRIVEKPDEVPPEAVLVIRSHGVAQSVYEEIAAVTPPAPLWRKSTESSPPAAMKKQRC